MSKSCLKTQLLIGSAIFIFGQTGKSILYVAFGSAAGAIAGGLLGGAVGGIVLGPPGIIPGTLIGTVYGRNIGFSVGAGYALVKGWYEVSENIDSLYKDLEILKMTEDGKNPAMANTITVAHDIFEYFLDLINSIGMNGDILCPISKDVMIIPVKANCGCVFEAINLTNSLKVSRQCPKCKGEIKDAFFAYQTQKAVNDALTGVINHLKEYAGDQKLLLLKKHFTRRGFTQLNQITKEKLKHKAPISLEETRTLYYIVSQYKMNCQKVTKFIKDAWTLKLVENLSEGKISLQEFGECNDKLQNWIKD